MKSGIVGGWRDRRGGDGDSRGGEGLLSGGEASPARGRVDTSDGGRGRGRDRHVAVGGWREVQESLCVNYSDFLGTERAGGGGRRKRRAPCGVVKQFGARSERGTRREGSDGGVAPRSVTKDSEGRT